MNQFEKQKAADAKIEAMFQTFNEFMLAYHSSNEDALIFREWEDLKKIIATEPRNLEAQNKFIDRIASSKIERPFSPLRRKNPQNLNGRIGKPKAV